MKHKTLLMTVLIVVVLTGLVVGISLVLQPEQTALGLALIIGSALVGVVSVLGGLNDVSEFIEKVFGTEKDTSEQETPAEPTQSETRVSATDHSVGVAGNVGRDVNIYHGTPPAPDAEPYTPPAPPDADVIPDPGPLPPGSRVLLARNANFTGREEALWTLAHTLLHGAGAALVTQAVQGMGGVGKTQLAVEFAHRYGRFFHGVHWINAAEPETLEAEVAACGRAMGLQPWPEQLPDQVGVTLAAWQRGGPRLLILDNLEDVATARAWLGRLSGGPLRVLLTARLADWPGDLGLATLRLDIFSPEESRALLEKTSEVSETSEVWDTLAERLGHLPLALDLAGRYLKRHPRKRVAEYVEELDEVLAHRSMRRWRQDLGNPTGHDLDLMATFALSWEEVDDPAAQRLFRMAGYCAPNEPIPCALLERAADLDQDACDEALSALTGLGLLTWPPATRSPAPPRNGEGGMNRGGVVIHPLLAEYARTLSSLDIEKGRAEEGLAALADTLATMTGEALDTGLPERFLPLRAHVRAIARWAVEAGVESAGALWNNLGYHLWMVADYAGAKAAYEWALRIDEAVYGPDHPDVAIDVNNLGLVLKAQGDLARAREAYERALCIDEAVYGPEHPNVATAHNNLGDVLQDLGDLARAQAAYERALRIWQQVYGEEHPRVATAHNNLGGVLQDQGDLAQAQAAFERVLNILDKTLPPEHPYVASTVNNLGSVLQAQGDLAGAKAALERALRIDEAVYGPDHPAVATDVNNLGSVLKDQGDLEGARAAFERALRIKEQIYESDHPSIATTVNNLGLVLQAQGDLAGAREAYERALRIDEAAYGSDHPSVARDVNNLGVALQAQGDLAGAREAYERALRIFETFLPADHPHIETVRGNLDYLKSQKS
jgi:tetratricopeptide (TPR) repeat protein